jgi:outer membrane protein assembly factor BamB
MLPVLLSAPPIAAQTPPILWRFDTRDASFGQTAAGDIDGDGRLELVFGCYRNDSCVYALNAEDGSLLWKFNTTDMQEGCNDVAPLIADVDADGALDVVLPSSCNPTTYCFDGRNGSVKWSTRTRGSDSPPTIADVDGDGRLEILHGEFGGWVICLDAATGAVEWELAVDTRSWIQTAPTLLDADGDGAMDFIVATWNRTQGDTNAVRAFRGRDRALLWRAPLTDVVYHGTAVADFDGDGRPELCLGDYSGALTTLNAEDGSLAWSIPSPGQYHYIGAPVTIADLDGDALPEAVYVSWYKVFAVRHDGSPLWSFDIPAYATAFRGAALTDVDGDALPDAIFGTSGGELTALRGTDGAHLWTVDLAADMGRTDFALDHAPVIADFDGDGALDVFIVGGHAEYPEFSRDYGRAYALRIGRGTGPPWLMFQGNPQRSGRLIPEQPTGIDIRHAAVPTQVSLFPNPAHGHVAVAANGLHRVVIFDALGRQVTTVHSPTDRVDLDLSRCAAGIYYVLTTTTNGLNAERLIVQ